MPGLAGLALGLHEQHGLHRLDVGPDHLGQRLHDDGMVEDSTENGGNLVRKVDRGVAPHRGFVGLAGGRQLDTLDRSALASADRCCLGDQLGHLAAGQRAREHDVAVGGVAIKVHSFLNDRHMTTVRRRLRGNNGSMTHGTV